MAGSRWGLCQVNHLEWAPESNAAGSGPMFSGVSVKSTAGLVVIIGACC